MSEIDEKGVEAALGIAEADAKRHKLSTYGACEKAIAAIANDPPSYDRDRALAAFKEARNQLRAEVGDGRS